MEDSRRKFMKTLALGVGALVVSPILRFQGAFAAELAKDSDALVKALGYVPNVAALKGKAEPKGHTKGASCKSCQFYADPKAKQAKCQLIQSGDVLATGWCRSYSAAAKPAAKPAKKG